GGASAPQAFQIGSGAGPDPVTVTEPTAGATVAPGAIQFSGTAGPGAELVVMVDGVEMTRITADGDGAWATEIELSEGAHSIVVAPMSTDGTVVFDEAASAPVEFLAEATGVAPVITEPETSAELSAGPVIFRGTAAPGSTIVLQLDGEDVRTVVAEDDGSWSAEIDLPAGEHELVAVATQPDGLEATSAAFDVAATAALPVITSPAAGNVTSGNVVVRGTASPNQTLEIVVDGVVVGTTTTDARGNWFLSTPLTAGARSVTARYPGAADSAEPVAYSVQQRRPGGQCRNTTPIAAEVSRYTVEVNDTLYCISQRSGLSITTLRRDNPFITDENLILPGQVLALREHVPPTPTPTPAPAP
ncbi:MAG TPA: LysM domain-containing protein, partial [Anaerolineales bacterium]|nr:LysM domain-containing protein [Anaerolineales bacterium]